MTYFSGFTSHQPCHTNFKRIHCDFEKVKPCMFKIIQKLLWVFISSQYGLNTCSYTIILIKTSSQKSKTRVGYIIFHNNDFAALWDHDKVFRLSKNTFPGNFSFIADWKWNFHHFSTVNKPFWCPNRSSWFEQGFLKTGSQQRTTKNAEVWEVN